MFRKKGLLSNYWNMWRRTFDFKGLCSVREYRSAFLMHLAIIILLTIVCVIFPAGGVTVCILSVYGILSLIPFLAMSVRRFHDAGKSGWWAILVLLGIGIVFCICWTAGVMSAYYELISSFSAVYGPPPVE